VRALVLRSPGRPMELTELPEPTASSGHVVVRVRACGVGLTLAWTAQDRWSGGSEPGKLPRVIGHEIAGEVVEVASDVRHVRVGDRVVAYYYLTCGVCRYCALGRETLCDNLRGWIGRQIDGGLAEYVSLPAWNTRPLPASVSYEDGAVASDAVATPLHVLRSRARVSPGETVVVVGGAGGVGIHAVLVAKALGARAICVDIGDEKMAFALQAGADLAIDASDAPFDEQVMDYTGGMGADVVVEMVGTDETVSPSLRSLSKVGRLLLVGTYEPGTPLGLSVRSLTGEQAVIASRYCTRSEVSEALSLVEHGTVSPVITVRCSLEEVQDVLDAIVRREVAGRAVMTIAS
jgi:D-arabinose 1-dehydrogenase-like Zn-dependent alcohol dehydrogenase